MMRRKLVIFLMVAVGVAGCHAGAGAGTSAAAAYKVYKLRGKVVSTDTAAGEVTVNHEAIAGFMGAMMMPYKVKDPSVLSGLHAGDTVTADVLVAPEANAEPLLDHFVVEAKGSPDSKQK